MGEEGRRPPQGACNIYNYSGKMTIYVLGCCMVAATGGFIFGYEIGISGGVTSMDSFLEKFFPDVYQNMHKADYNGNLYCKFDSQLLTAFTSSLYISGLLSSFVAARTTRDYGRKNSMLIGSIAVLLGSIISGAAVNLIMLLAGRLLLGAGVGFAAQSVPVYLSEMAPPNQRGALNMVFQLAVTLGIFVSSLVNYETNHMKGGHGWRVSLALVGVPALLFAVGSAILPETPNSLIERGHVHEARAMLKLIRGGEKTDAELKDLVEASIAAKRVKSPWKEIRESKYRPQLTMAIAIPFFQQFTGINVIMFYAPVLFRMLGFGKNVSLISTVISGVVNVAATIVSILTVDRYGRRFLFMKGGIQMLVCQIAIGIILGVRFGGSGRGNLEVVDAHFLLFFIFFYVAAYAWSWGALGWLVPSEIFPLEIRSVGQTVTVSSNLFFSFFVAQAFLAMLCRLKFGFFFFFGCFVLIMTTFIYFLLPETMHVPIEDTNKVWRQHCFWGKFIPDEQPECLDEERT